MDTLCVVLWQAIVFTIANVTPTVKEELCYTLLCVLGSEVQTWFTVECIDGFFWALAEYFQHNRRVWISKSTSNYWFWQTVREFMCVFPQHWVSKAILLYCFTGIDFLPQSLPKSFMKTIHCDRRCRRHHSTSRLGHIHHCDLQHGLAWEISHGVHNFSWKLVHPL